MSELKETKENIVKSPTKDDINKQMKELQLMNPFIKGEINPNIESKMDDILKLIKSMNKMDKDIKWERKQINIINKIKRKLLRNSHKKKKNIQKNDPYIQKYSKLKEIYKSIQNGSTNELESKQYSNDLCEMAQEIYNLTDKYYGEIITINDIKVFDGINLIFLDVDGVLNSGIGLPLKSKLLLLFTLINDYNCRIIISSSWKESHVGYYELLSSFKLIIDEMKYSNININNIIYGATPNKINGGRAVEILKWFEMIRNDEINKNILNKINNYVIIDDINLKLKGKSNSVIDKHFVQTNYKNGIANDDIKKCQNILSVKSNVTVSLMF